jgi:hypothetical protein
MKLTKKQKDRYKMLMIRLLDYYKIDKDATENIKEKLAFKWINLKSDERIAKQINVALNSIKISNKDSYLSYL